MTTKQVRDLRTGDIIRFKDKESRLITRINYNPYSIRTIDLSGAHERTDTYIGIDKVIIEEVVAR